MKRPPGLEMRSTKEMQVNNLHFLINRDILMYLF